jgi:hypothetical protein
MTIKETLQKIKIFIIVDLKKFLWYVFTEPFRIFINLFKGVKEKFDIIQALQSWLVIFSVLSILTLLAGNIPAAKAFAVCLGVFIIVYEWNRGFFRYRWKQKEIHRVTKKYEKEKVKLDGDVKVADNNAPGHGNP